MRSIDEHIGGKRSRMRPVDFRLDIVYRNNCRFDETHSTAIVWIGYGLVIKVRSPEPDFSGRVAWSDCLQVSEIVHVRGKDVGEAGEV